MGHEIKENHRTLGFHQLHVLRSSRSIHGDDLSHHKIWTSIINFINMECAKFLKITTFDLLGGIKIAAFGLRVRESSKTHAIIKMWKTAVKKYGRVQILLHKVKESSVQILVRPNSDPDWSSLHYWITHPLYRNLITAWTCNKIKA